VGALYPRSGRDNVNQTRKTMAQNELQSVMIDSREPEWVQKLTFGGVPAAVVALECGDVWAATTDGSILVIERKTTTDLLASIKDNRIFQQAKAMREQSAWAYIVITGALIPGPDGKVIAGGRETGWDWNAVQGALLTIQEMGVSIVTCVNDAEFGATVTRLAQRGREEVRVEPRRLAYLVGAGEAALAALPGIGPERVQTLLSYCGTPAWALTFLTDTTNGQHVTGIGDNTKRAVRKALGLEDWAELAVVERKNGQPIERKGN